MFTTAANFYHFVNLQRKWKRWLNEVPELNNFEIDRCIKPKHCIGIKRSSLHHFCDSSESAMAAVSYLKIEDINGNYQVSLLFCKSKLPPIKNSPCLGLSCLLPSLPTTMIAC